MGELPLPKTKAAMSENGVWAPCALRRGRSGKAGVQTRDNPEHVLTVKGVLLSPLHLLGVRRSERVGLVCKTGAFVLSRCESYHTHHFLAVYDLELEPEKVADRPSFRLVNAGKSESRSFQRQPVNQPNQEVIMKTNEQEEELPFHRGHQQKTKRVSLGNTGETGSPDYWWRQRASREAGPK